jgi:hypothetical protein
MRSITMSRVLLSGALALGALGAVGGFTPGVATAEAAPSVSPFAGSWSGTWSAVDVALVGTYDWTISDAGRITGTVYGTTSGRSGTVVGHVDADGTLVLIRYTPNDDPSSGYGAIHFGATAVIDGDGKLVALLAGVGGNTGSHLAILERN